MKTIAVIFLTFVLGTTGIWAECIGEAVEVRIVNDEGTNVADLPGKDGPGSAQGLRGGD